MENRRDASLLVVSNPDDRSEIEALLAKEGFAQVVHEPGSETTVVRARELNPVVVILSAELDQGDARTVAATIKEELQRTSIVLLGQADGPIRNALDATDFEVDHFVGRPWSHKALGFAVRAGIENAGRLASVPASSADPLSDEAISSRAQTESMIGSAMDEAIAAFVDDAIASIPDSDELENIAEISGDGVVTAAHDEPTAKSGHPAAENWREETVVLKDEGRSAPPPASPPNFAQQLRDKMSEMAQRLFPGEQVPSEAALHDAHTEIDLSDLGSPPTLGGHGDDPHPSTGLVELDTSTRETDDWSNSGTRLKTNDPSSRRTSGSLDEPGDDVASLIARLFDLGVTGEVVFQRSETVKTVYFDRGRPVFATSNLPHDRMGDMLFREGKLTRQQHVRSRELVAESGRRMGQILVDEGFLKPKELMPAVRRHLEDLLYSLFGWADGEFEISEAAVPVPESIRLTRHPAALVLEGIRRKYDLGRIIALIGSSDPVIALGDLERVRALSTQLELLPAEERAISGLDGEMTLSEVALQCHTDKLTVGQVAFALIALGVARVLGGVTTSRGMVRDLDSRSDEQDPAIDRERIRAKYQLVIESDYFQVLGVRRDASGFEIRRAFESAVKDFDSQSFASSVRGELAFEIEEIGVVLEEAFAVLSDDRVRDSYLRHLKE